MTINYQNPYGFSPCMSGNYPHNFYQQHNPFMIEQSYIENILRLNRGKVATVYMNFEGSQWGSKVFKGEILEAGKDHLIIKDLQTNMTYMLLTIYLSYVAFDEDIEYEYPFS